MQAVQEITATIERELQQASAKLDEFVATQNASLSKAQQEHEAIMLEAERKIQKLKMDEATAQDRAGTLSEHLTAERKMHADKNGEVARLEAQAATLPGDVDLVKSKEDAVKEQLAATKGEYERQESELRHQLAEMANGMAYYAKLGLAFEKQPDNDRLRLVFTQLDPAAPDRRFTFCVVVTEEEVYEVTDCAPPVPSLAALVTELNATNDFSRFVQYMRRAFKAVCLAGHGVR